MKTGLRMIFSLALTVNLASVGWTQSPQTITVPQGTIVRLSLQTPVSTKISEVGDPVRAVLYDDLYVDGNLVLGRGTEFVGRVSHVKQARRGQKQSELAIVFDRLVTSYGEEPVKTVLAAIDDWQGDKKIKSDDEGVARGGRSGERTLENVYRGSHIGLAAGTAIGLITRSGMAAGIVIASTLGGAVLMSKGADIRLNQGAILRVRIEQPIELPVIRPASKKGDGSSPPEK